MNQQYSHYTATSAMKYSISNAAMYQSAAAESNSAVQHSTATANSTTMHQSTASSSSSAMYQSGPSPGMKPLLETPAEECRRSFEQAELEAMALDSETSRSFSKQSSVVETCSTQSFVMQDQNHQQQNNESRINKSESYSRNLDAFQNSRKPVKSSSFVRKPDTFTPGERSGGAYSVPTTPMSGRRRLRINQSPKPPEEAEQQPKYKESPTAPFQPGFYKKPPEDSDRNHIFQLNQRSGNRSRNVNSVEPPMQSGARNSQASSKAYDGDYESDL